VGAPWARCISINTQPPEISEPTCFPSTTPPFPRDTGRAMSEENVKTVRDAFVAYNRGHLDAFLERARRAA
jgi:hypothetical protein